jgi:hypothetical protein
MGIYCHYPAEIELHNVSMINPNNSFAGYGIYNKGGKVLISNSIINGFSFGIVNQDQGNINISYSNVSSYYKTYPGLDSSIGLLAKINANGDSSDVFFNISKDPFFKGNEYPLFDFHLQDSSPCIGAGTAVDAPAFDIEGNRRGTTPDMGAYENPLNKPSPVMVEDRAPSALDLFQCSPNPFNASTTITFEIPEPGLVSLSIYNITGQKMRDLVNEYFDSGTHFVKWNGLNEAGVPVASGLYFVRLEADKYIGRGKMVLMR